MGDFGLRVNEIHLGVQLAHYRNSLMVVRAWLCVAGLGELLLECQKIGLIVSKIGVRYALKFVTPRGGKGLQDHTAGLRYLVRAAWGLRYLVHGG